MDHIKVKDGTKIFFKDWGTGRPSSSTTAGRSPPMTGMGR